MTKKELKLEAIKYLENFKDCANCKNRWGDCADQLDEYCLINNACFATQKEQDIYLAGAEPREKRIAELEAQIEKMKCWCNCKNYLSCLEECCRKNISFEKGICYNCKKWELRR